MLKEIRETFRYRYVVYYFVYTGLKVRYQRSALGYLWTVLAPMAYYLVLAFVFSYGMRVTVPGQNYYVYMFSGSVIFGTMANVINQSCMIMIRNENYIKKIYVPKLVYLINQVCYEFVNLLMIIAALLILGLVSRQINLSLNLFILIIPIILAALFSTGIGLILSVFTLYLRDLNQIIPVLMNTLFFATPIMYYRNNVPPVINTLNEFNPFNYYVDLFRLPFHLNYYNSSNLFLVCTGLSLLSILCGLYILDKFNNRIIFKL